MINKIVTVVGILGALVAAEGLNRFGGLVSALGGGDAPYYMAMLVLSVISAGVLLLGLFNKSHAILKWIVVVLLSGSTGLMFVAPALPVNIQIIIGLGVAAVAAIFMRTRTGEKT